eukprot:CAMPEP_0171313662 /NCGR_PEP_ID=MMETSP0816-20121228/44815_1 /TAXON_ID=420281 /ORGANISM="Proboscia inermis, Strain CCAP1064/1" /LENGTH=41 /DNA_ID= /DNA_START= /DNA_END= /DNA_ORIENTATION=
MTNERVGRVVAAEKRGGEVGSYGTNTHTHIVIIKRVFHEMG